VNTPDEGGTEAGRHRLVGILNADVVGYSRLMSQNEGATVVMLNARRACIERIVPRHRGRLVDFSGDNFLAAFPTALECVRCAQDIQAAVAELNAAHPPERRMEFRMGAHLGDVRIEGERIYGEGVNIAARLQGLADPGGICISAAVREQVKNKLSVRFADAGAQSVKNIPHAVRAYHIRLSEAARATPRRRSSRPRHLRWWALAAGGAAVLLAALTIGRPLAIGFAFDRLGLSSASPDLALPEVPSLVVLPFENLSGDPEQGYFSDAITEDLTTDLSRHPFLFVISRTSAFAYKDKPVKVGEVARELGVRYVVEGSVRKVAQRVRVTAQLIEARTGLHLWSGRWDREYADVLALQSEVSEQILAALTGEIDQAEFERIRRQPVGDLTAFDLTLRARFRAYGSTREDNAEARRLVERALDLDPGRAEALAILGATHYWDYARGWDVDPSHLERAEELAHRSIELDPCSALGHLVLGATNLLRGRSAEAVAASERAVEAAPSYELPHLSLARALAQSGRYVEAMRSLRRAFRLSPHPGPDLLVLEGYLNFLTGRRDQAIEIWERARAAAPSHTTARIPLAIAYAYDGRDEAARRLVAELQSIAPSLSAEQALELVPSGELLGAPEKAEYVALLRDAGLP
jgi:adenylate cyclase